MFTSRFDRKAHAVLWLMSGSSNSDADYENYISSILEFDAMASPWKWAAAFMHVDVENPRPSPLWRQRIAQATITLKSRPFFALSSESAMMRGVITAINWLRPPPFVFSTHATFAGSVAWMEGQTGQPLPSAMELLLGARADAAVRR